MIIRKRIELTAKYYGKKVIIEVRKGLKLLWMLGNFFTKDNSIFILKDGNTFMVKE